MQETRLRPPVGKAPLRREWQPTQCPRLENPTDGGLKSLEVTESELSSQRSKRKTSGLNRSHAAGQRNRRAVVHLSPPSPELACKTGETLSPLNIRSTFSLSPWKPPSESMNLL